MACQQLHGLPGKENAASKTPLRGKLNLDDRLLVLKARIPATGTGMDLVAPVCVLRILKLPVIITHLESPLELGQK